MNTGPAPKYFDYKRGVTWLNAGNDQVAGIGAIVPGTPRDRMHTLDELLNLDGGPQPDLVDSDEASYSEMVFGSFSGLGCGPLHQLPTSVTPGTGGLNGPATPE